MKKFKQIEKQVKIYNKIKELDKEIIKIEKIAERLVKGNIEGLDIQISFPGEDKIATTIDYAEYRLSYFSAFLSSRKEDEYVKKEEKPSYTTKIDDILSFELLGLLIGRLNEDRKTLLNEIEKV